MSVYTRDLSHRRWVQKCFICLFALIFVVITNGIKAKCLSSAAAAKSLQSCLTLCDPIDRSPPCFPVPGILQAITLEWVAISFSSAWKWSRSVVSNSSDSMDCSLPDSSTHGIFQAKVLEWGATAFSSGYWQKPQHTKKYSSIII